MKNAVQRFGKFLSSMVMPNIGAFIAWGFITALFIEKGWLPNAQLATLNGPMLNYLLPVLIAFQGGKLIGGTDAWVMGAYTSRLANEKVKWETSEQYNLGIDARFLRQRLSLTFDTYIKNTKDWLVQAPVLATAGTQGPVINGGDVKNKGVELGLSWNDQIGKDFVYSTLYCSEVSHFTFSLARRSV